MLTREQAIEILRRRVLRGCRLLDQEMPGWAKMVSPKVLEMNHCDRCVLGQLYGNYYDGARAIGLCPQTVEDRTPFYGFYASDSERLDRVLPRGRVYEVLASLWRDEIKQRRATAPVTETVRT